MKRCSACEVEKSPTEFYRRSSSSDSLDGRCKECMREIKRKWSHANREREAERMRKHRAANPEASRAATRRWREKNPEKRAAYEDATKDQKRAWNKEYRERNLERQRAAVRAWGRTNSGRRAEQRKRHYEENREHVMETVRAWREANPERHREIMYRAAARRRARKLSAFVENVDRHVSYQMHGGRCGICGEFIDLSVGNFHVDHIVPLSKGGAHSYANTQPAHPSCNSRKRDRLDFTLERS